MSQRRPDLFNILLILALGAAVIWVSIILGKSPIGYAFGKDMAVTWTAPTGNCNNTPLTDLTGFRVRWGNGSTDLPPSATAFTVQDLAPGRWWVNVAAYNSQNVESQYVAGWMDVAPEEFVTTGTVVYTFAKRTDGILVLPVGTIPTGVVCDATQSVNGKYVVPRSAVTWSGLTRPVVVLGDCG